MGSCEQAGLKGCSRGFECGRPLAFCGVQREGASTRFYSDLLGSSAVLGACSVLGALKVWVSTVVPELTVWGGERSTDIATIRENKSEFMLENLCICFVL